MYICRSIYNLLCAAFGVPKYMRPITAGVTSGGLTGLLASVAKETLQGPTLSELERVCTSPNLTWQIWGIELEVKSLVIGIFLGLCAGSDLPFAAAGSPLLAKGFHSFPGAQASSQSLEGA